MKPLTNVSRIELSVGLRSAARLLVLRGRDDIELRRESLAEAAAVNSCHLPGLAETLNRINADPLCLACEK